MSEDQTIKESKPFVIKPLHIEILRAVHRYEGMLGFKQVWRLLFNSKRSTRRYLSDLKKEGYLAYLTYRQRFAQDDMAHWLTAKGAKVVAETEGVDFKDFKWYDEPRFSQIDHDFKVVDFWMDMEEAVENEERITFVDNWYSSRYFGSQYDRISYTDVDGKRRKRGVRPDGFFVLYDGTYQYPMLVEIDNNTFDAPRFGRDKIAPGIAYLQSSEYQKHFGYEYGRFIIVTVLESKMKKLMKQTKTVLKRVGQEQWTNLFLFTTFDKVAPKTVLSKPIWHIAGMERRVTLLEHVV